MVFAVLMLRYFHTSIEQIPENLALLKKRQSFASNYLPTCARTTAFGRRRLLGRPLFVVWRLFAFNVYCTARTLCFCWLSLRYGKGCSSVRAKVGQNKHFHYFMLRSTLVRKLAASFSHRLIVRNRARHHQRRKNTQNCLTSTRYAHDQPFAHAHSVRRTRTDLARL